MRVNIIQEGDMNVDREERDRMAQTQERDAPDTRPKVREKPLVKDLNEHIICPICRGYLIDATTLSECVHSFCRDCIARHLRNGPKTCPVCKANVLEPLTSDVGLQRLVYLMVPGLFKSEMDRRRQIRQTDPQCSTSTSTSSLSPPPPLGAPELGFDELVSLSLSEFDSNCEGSTRYLKCPAGVTVRHLLRLLMLKRGWGTTEGNDQQSGNNKIEMMYEVSGDKDERQFEVLKPSWTLMDLACIFEWKREAPMKLLYRVTRINEASIQKSPISCPTTNVSSSPMTTPDTPNQSIENIQRPPTPPPSPKPAISRIDSHKSSKGAVASGTTITEHHHELRKPRCEVTPVMRAPDPPPPSTKPNKLQKLEHKRKKRRNKRVIAEITTTPREDMLKLKVRLTPCPPRVSSNNVINSNNQVTSKDKLAQLKAVRKEKVRDKSNIVPAKNCSSSVQKKEETLTVSAKPAASNSDKANLGKVEVESKKTAEVEESPKNEDVLRKLGLVAISEAVKNRQDKLKGQNAQTGTDGVSSAEEREKLEKQLRESKANRVRSLLAEKQMRDTLKSMESGSNKRKDPPPLTPLKASKRPNVTFAPETPLDLSSPNVLDLSSNTSETPIIHGTKTKPEEKLVGILRNNLTKSTGEKVKDEVNKSQNANLKTLSDVAVSRLSGKTLDESSGKQLNFVSNKVTMASPLASKVALRIPQPHQRLSGFGMKIKPNVGVRHIPNPQAVVASQYRNQRSGFYSLTHQPP
ncbi:hypothetical protein QAD02_011670 [Eretmocerus hayati]|uniref:Uncharacterized protein n=1 Tax=Eretmocerus hayati TaxID=131215 RepID=A0ACC2NXT2_9HYME|nr:hypothetical protein QAD02_011670 [Eretmocerus hayati]